ncbi:MAG TPA: hypothetical protein DD403_12560 [Pseudomonas sp.]|jgi:hypothetical protein|nr:hypothetical protein [Pseudomonas sp.]|tara:strand:- start:1412 stop:1762 length:351 start_codon:yes stop_codon:yes gene_type:complete
MNIIKGTVIAVVDKGEGDKQWAIVALSTTAKDRDGIDIVKTVKVRVFGDMHKGGMHNAYRGQVGVEVYMPVNAEANTKYNSVDYTVAGIPLRLQEARPVQSAPAGQPAPAKVAGAN